MSIVASPAPSTRAGARAADTAAVLWICPDGKSAPALRRRLESRAGWFVADSEEEALSLACRGPFGVIVVSPTTHEQALEQILADAGDAATTLLFVGRRPPHSHLSAVNGLTIRHLTDPSAPDVLEQIVEDYLERRRLLQIERELNQQLLLLQSRLDKLSKNLTAEGVQSTASLLRLYHVVSGLSGLTTPREVAELVVSTAARMMHSNRVCLLVPDADGECLTVAAAAGTGVQNLENCRIPIGAPVAGEAFANGRSVLVRDDRPPTGWNSRQDGEIIRSLPFIAITLVGPDCPVAVLCVSEPEGREAYTQESLTGLQAITDAAAIALANQLRGQERNEARDSVMMAMAKLAESRDPETGTHLERVQNYCRILAEELARTDKYRETITPAFIGTLVWSSPLHDIGKVGVPDHILLKPGRLTPEEFEIMKRHAVIGGDTIKALRTKGRRQDFLRMAMDIAYHHHEKFDGSGYPHELSGEDIPLAARIMALADVYDALTSARVYKAPVPHAEAVDMIRQGSGGHFDPGICEAFLRREGEFEKLAEELADTDEVFPSTASRGESGPGAPTNVSSRTGGPG